MYNIYGCEALCGVFRIGGRRPPGLGDDAGGRLRTGQLVLAADVVAQRHDGRKVQVTFLSANMSNDFFSTAKIGV
jgi:hypothetical protein